MSGDRRDDTDLGLGPEPTEDVEMNDNTSDLEPDDADFFVVVSPHGTEVDSAADTLALAPETAPDG